MEHLKRVLRLEAGDTISAGMINSSKGRALLLSICETEAVLEYHSESSSPVVLPLTLIVGQVRPIQAKRILKIAANYGVFRLVWTATSLGEKSYAQASLWKDHKYEGPLIEGAVQGGMFRLPEIAIYRGLRQCLREELSRQSSDQGLNKLLFHPGKQVPGFAKFSVAGKNTIAAVGSERGWTEKELEILEEMGFIPYHLGPAILRTEGAVNAALALMALKTGLMDPDPVSLE